jgi:hypothetical protein
MKYIIHPDDWKEIVKEASEEAVPILPIPPIDAVGVIVSEYAIKGKPFPVPDLPAFYYRKPPRLGDDKSFTYRVRTF